MTDNDIAMIAELHTWNKQNGIPVMSLWGALEQVYGNYRANIASEYYKRMKRGKYKKRGRPRCTRTEVTDRKNT